MIHILLHSTQGNDGIDAFRGVKSDSRQRRPADEPHNRRLFSGFAWYKWTILLRRESEEYHRLHHRQIRRRDPTEVATGERMLLIYYLRKKSSHGGMGHISAFPYKNWGCKMRLIFCSFDLVYQRGPYYSKVCVNSSKRKGSQLERAT